MDNCVYLKLGVGVIFIVIEKFEFKYCCFRLFDMNENCVRKN